LAGPFPSELEILGLGKEVTWGTAVVPDFYLSAKNIKAEDVIKYVKDQGMRGVMATTQNVYAGVQSSTFSADFEVFPDSLGRVLQAIIGTDAVTGTTPNFIHTFKLNKTSQPISSTINYFDGYETRQYAGAMLTELSLKWSEGADVQGSFKAEGKPSVVGTALTQAYGTLTAFQGWQAALTIGGTADLNLVGFQLDLKRKAYTQYAANDSQAPSAIIAKGLEVTGKMTFDIAGDTELTAFLTNTQPIVVVTLTQNTNTSLQITMSQCAFMKAPLGGKDVVQLDVDFEGVNNTTDGGPVAVVLKNQTATY